MFTHATTLRRKRIRRMKKHRARALSRNECSVNSVLATDWVGSAMTQVPDMEAYIEDEQNPKTYAFGL